MIIYMHWFLFSWIIFYPKTELCNTVLLSTSIILRPNKTDGTDYRFNKSESESEIEMEKIRQNIRRMNQLCFLENPSISMFDKLLVIEQEKNGIYGPNIQNGGLFDDF